MSLSEVIHVEYLRDGTIDMIYRHLTARESVHRAVTSVEIKRLRAQANIRSGGKSRGCRRALFALYLASTYSRELKCSIRNRRNSSPRGAPRSRSDARRGTVRQLWPYIWPSDRADLKLRVLLAVVVHDRGQVRHDRHSLCVQMGDRRAGGRRRGGQDSPARAADRRRRADGPLRRAAHADGAVHAGPRRAVRGGGDERRAAPRHRGLRPSAPTVAALSSRAQDRRPDARSRARPQRDRDDHPHLDADRGADARRIRADPRRVSVLVRLALRRWPSR